MIIPLFCTRGSLPMSGNAVADSPAVVSPVTADDRRLASARLAEDVFDLGTGGGYAANTATLRVASHFSTPATEETTAGMIVRKRTKHLPIILPIKPPHNLPLNSIPVEPEMVHTALFLLFGRQHNYYATLSTNSRLSLHIVVQNRWDENVTVGILIILQNRH